MASNADHPVGRTQDGSYQVGARRTLAIPPSAAWDLVMSERGLAAWLGPLVGGSLGPKGDYRLADGTSGEVRVYQPGSHIRLTWRPPNWDRPSTIQLRVIDRTDRSVIALHQEGLPSGEARSARKQAFHQALDDLQLLI